MIHHRRFFRIPGKLIKLGRFLPLFFQFKNSTDLLVGLSFFIDAYCFFILAGLFKELGGAVKVIREGGKSLLPVGVQTVEGVFTRGEIVSCLDPEGREVARGLVNYSAEEAARIIGKASDKIESILGYVDEPELIHRDNMVVI